MTLKDFKENVQKYVDTNYPDFYLDVYNVCGCPTVIECKGYFAFSACVRSDESTNVIKDRLIESLKDVKKLIEDDIDKLEHA